MNKPLQTNCLGQIYDPSVPCFLAAANDMAYNRVDRKWHDVKSLSEKIEAAGGPAENEAGLAPEAWIKANNMEDVEWLTTAPVEPTEPEKTEKPKVEKPKK